MSRRPSPDEFRSAISRLPGGIVVISSHRNGIDHAMTASAVTSVSLEPPMLLFCVHEDARFREVMDDVDTWAVSVLSDSASAIAQWLASPGRPVVGQFSQVPFHRGEYSDAPLIDDAAAWFECRTHAIHTAGDHDIVIGDVVRATQGAAAAGGLVHLRGQIRPVV